MEKTEKEAAVAQPVEENKRRKRRTCKFEAIEPCKSRDPLVAGSNPAGGSTNLFL